MSVTESGPTIRFSDAVSLALLAVTAAVGVLAYDAIPAAMVIHYTPPGGVYYGPETVATAVGLSIVPAVSVVTFAVVRALPIVDDVGEQLAPIRPYYQACLVAVLLCLAGAQVALVVLNL